MTRRNKLAMIIALVTMVTSLATLLLLLKKKEEEEINQLADDFVDNYEECNYDEIYREFESSEPIEDINVPPITEE